ncbi:hypothetical protein S7711_02372 [Stachybotrys chartarum IBT 7711]|uniref:Heterokaryon incompatibility domain-containing protein n=1 Tax=Stachybotrys chartarum (strain CBS 109288 / IBT 7711) TaxID=1280523 RepID=A0A084B137_STACB|nr:hypothetical protein S7711_02372 [Stachybotrys chartarum IBT 7711]
MYRALDHSIDELRLLYLKPTVATQDNSYEGDLIVSELQHHRLANAPPFVALSYCWGRSFKQSPILIDGRVQKCGANGEDALRHLRGEQGIHIWIDQLCINQADNDEKNHQVQMMLRIYETACRVVVWMGPSGDDSDVFIPHVRVMSALLRDGKHLDVVRSYTDSGFLRRMSLAFKAFCEREYWTRLWIIQEFAVARELDILCGAFSISYGDLREFLLFFNQLYVHLPIVQEQGDPEIMKAFVDMMRGFFKSPSQSFLEGVFTRRRRYQMRFDPSARSTTNPTVVSVENAMLKERESLFAVLVTTLVLEIDYNHTQVTDPRDRVFAIMHFADDVGEFKSLPNYNLSCEQVYQDVARHILQQGNVDLLSYCQFPHETPLSTWAPDWRIGIKRPCVGNPWFSKFNASNDSASKQAVVVPDSRTISLRGVLVDTVQEMGKVWNPDWITDLDCKAALAYIDEIEYLCTKSPRLCGKIKQQDFIDVMRICIADHYYYKEPERQPELVQGFVEAVTHMKKALERNGENKELDLHLDDPIGWQQPWFMFAMKNLHSRRPFITKSGYVGLAPMHAQQGDKVVIFQGGKTPYMVRDASQGYELVGETYLHGVMYGEYMTETVDIDRFLIV